MSGFPKSDYFTVGPVTASYVDGMFVPQKKKGGGEGYNFNIIFTEEQRAYIQQWVDYIGAQAFPSEWAIPNKVKKPIRSVDEKPNYAARFPGHFFASVKSQFMPQVVDVNKQVLPANIVDPTRTDGQKVFYGGVQVYVSINVWSNRHPEGGPNVSLGVQAVMKFADAEPLIEQGSVDVAAVFAGVTSPAAGAMPPTMGGPAPAPVAPGAAPVAPGAAPVAPQAVPQAAPQAVPQAPQAVPQAAPQAPQAVPQAAPQAVPQAPQAPQAAPPGAPPPPPAYTG